MTKFDRLRDELAKKPGIYSPSGLAASIGRKKEGKATFQAEAAAGRRRAKK